MDFCGASLLSPQGAWGQAPAGRRSLLRPTAGSPIGAGSCPRQGEGMEVQLGQVCTLEKGQEG